MKEIKKEVLPFLLEDAMGREEREILLVRRFKKVERAHLLPNRPLPLKPARISL